MTAIIRDYDPAQGQAFQGDVAIIPVPEGIEIAETDEIKPVDGRLILQEGEVTGHHHAVSIDPSVGRSANFARNEAVALAGDPLQPILSARAKARAARPAAARTRLFRDRAAADAMVAAGVLERSDLCVGFLVVPPGQRTVVHEEHDGIRLPGGDGSTVQPDRNAWPKGYAFQAGRFYIGRQVESVGAEERRVAD